MQRFLKRPQFFILIAGLHWLARMAPAGSLLRSGGFVALGALCWSTSGLFVRGVQPINPWELIFWRSLGCALFIFFLLQRRHGAQLRPQLVALGWRGWVSGGLIAGLFIFFLLAMSYTSVANVALVMSAEPIFAAILAWIILRERLRSGTLIALCTTLVGLILIAFSNPIESATVLPYNLLGIACALLLNLIYATNLLIIKTTPSQLSLLPTIFLGGLFSGLIALFFAWPLQASGTTIGLLIVMGGVQLSLGFVFLLKGAPYLTMAQITLLGLIEAIISPLWVWLFFAETPAQLTLIGGAIVLVTIILHTLWQVRYPPSFMTPDSSTALASNQTTLYQQMGAADGVRQLVDRFYDEMDLSAEFASLRALHPQDLSGSRDKLFWFLSGYLGGPNLFVERFGHPRLRARHLPYVIDDLARDQWLACMQRALVVAAYPAALHQELMEYFQRTADWMRNQQPTTELKPLVRIKPALPE